jgi:hypothetical protein
VGLSWIEVDRAVPLALPAADAVALNSGSLPPFLLVIFTRKSTSFRFA